MKKILLLAKNYFQISMAYPLSILIWILILFIEPIIMITVWQQVSKNGISLPLTLSQIISYYLLSTLYYRLTQVWSLGKISKEIFKGNFLHFVLLPIHYFKIDFAHNIGLKVTRLIIIIPIFLLTIFLYRENFVIQLSGKSSVLLILSLITGFVLQSVLENVLSLLAFWFERMEKITELYSFFSSFLSGALIPLVFFPREVAFLFNILPYRYFLSFPLEITLGTLSDKEIVNGFFITFIWLVTLFLLYLNMYPKALKKYTGVGQ